MVAQLRGAFSTPRWSLPEPMRAVPVNDPALATVAWVAQPRL